MFRALLTRPTIFGLKGARIQKSISAIQVPRNKMAECSWKRCDKEFSPWAWIGTTHHQSPQKGFQGSPIDHQVFSELYSVQSRFPPRLSCRQETNPSPPSPVKTSWYSPIRGKRTGLKGSSVATQVRNG